mgnify:CR=1 FL=1
MKHSEMCDLLRRIGQSCGSTALACSMHQHLLSAMIWKYKQGKGGEELLTKIAEGQPILVSTGARDWLESNGEMKKVDGGYEVTAVKHFASQSAAGDILVTSAPYEDPDAGMRVLHFSVPFQSDGLLVIENWRAMGMRGTGSHSVKLDKVFVPEDAITLNRPKGELHPFWNVILTVAMPYIMSAYVGVAEKASVIAIEAVKNQGHRKPHTTSQVGEMNNALAAAQVQWKDMVRITSDLDIVPEHRDSHEILTRKTNVSQACIAVVTKAMKVMGGQGFYRSCELERLFRDVQASHYHPLQEYDQYLFSGEFLLSETEE